MEAKTDPMRPQNSARPRSWSVLTAKTPQDPPRPPQDRPKTRQDRPRLPQDLPQTRQHAPKTRPKFARDLTKTPQDPARPLKDSPRLPKGCQEAPKTARLLPERAQEATKGPKRLSGTGRAFEAVPPFKAGQTPGASFTVRLAWPGRLERPSRPDLT